MFRVGDHIMSMQGHPEFSEEYAHDVANLRKEILGEKEKRKRKEKTKQGENENRKRKEKKKREKEKRR